MGLDEGIPQSVGPFRIRGVLGQGGMGVVYRGEQSRPRRTVAVKVMAVGVLNETTMRRFELEIDILGRLEHEGIARLYEAGTVRVDTGERPYFAMEYLDGSNLVDYAREERLSVARKLDLFCRVCEAVQHAHANGVLHRDLKPANVLVTRAGPAEDPRLRRRAARRRPGGAHPHRRARRHALLHEPPSRRGETPTSTRVPTSTRSG